MKQLWKGIARLPDWSLYAWMVAVILLRVYIETGVLASVSYFSLTILLYHMAWFGCVFLSLAWFLYGWLRLSGHATLRLVSIGSSIIFLPVIASAITGIPADLEFIYGSIWQILFHIGTFTFFYDAVNIGFQIELLLLFCVLSGIGYFVTKQPKRAFLTGLIGYGAIVGAWLSLPVILGPANFYDASGVLTENTFSLVTIHSHLDGARFLATMYLLFFLLLLHGFGFFIYKEAFLSYFKNIRWKRVALFSIFAALAVLFQPTFFAYDLFLAMVIYTLLWSYMVAINDIYDLRIDMVSNKSRPLVTGVLDVKNMKVIGVISGVFAMLLAGLIGPAAFGVGLLTIVIGYIYSVPPVRLRDHSFGIVASTASQASAILIGYLSISGDPSLPAELGETYVFLWIAIIGLFQVKDLKDFEGDKREHIKNLLTVFGFEKGKRIIAFWFLVSFMLIGLILFPHTERFPLLFWSITIGLGVKLAYYLWSYTKPDEAVLFRGAFIYALLLLFFL